MDEEKASSIEEASSGVGSRTEEQMDVAHDAGGDAAAKDMDQQAEHDTQHPDREV